MVRNRQHSISFPVEPEQVPALLRNFGISPTQQRVQIASFLFRKAQHVTADEVLQGAKAIGAHVSRATVYNTLGLFIKKGLLRDVIIDRDKMYYDSNTEDHHHIYHVDSGRLTDVDPVEVPLPHPAALDDGQHVLGCDLILRVSGK